MLTISIVNAKGGCGKSTLTTNIASYFASMGLRVGIADFDPQGSSSAWLRYRAERFAPITSVPVINGEAKPDELDVLVMDAPAGLEGAALTRLLQNSIKVVIPVLPSSIDIRAVGHFIYELMQQDDAVLAEVDMAVVANRVKKNTVSYTVLENFLNQLSIPFVTTLRDSQQYVQAAAAGAGIFDLPDNNLEEDLAQWKPLMNWLMKRPDFLPETG